MSLKISFKDSPRDVLLVQMTTPDCRLIEAMMVSNVMYAIMEEKKPRGKNRLQGVIVVTSSKRSKVSDEVDFDYVVYPEDVCPINYCHAPKRLLRLLEEKSPHPTDAARRWRNACWAHHENRKPPKKLVFRPGMRLSGPVSDYVLQRPAGPRLGWIAKRVSDGLECRLRPNHLIMMKVVTLAA